MVINYPESLQYWPQGSLWVSEIESVEWMCSYFDISDGFRIREWKERKVWVRNRGEACVALTKSCFGLFKVMPSNEPEGRCQFRLPTRPVIKARLSAWGDSLQIVCVVSFERNPTIKRASACCVSHQTEQDNAAVNLKNSKKSWHLWRCAGEPIPRNVARHSETQTFIKCNTSGDCRRQEQPSVAEATPRRTLLRCTSSSSFSSDLQNPPQSQNHNDYMNYWKVSAEIMKRKMF